MKTIQNGLVNFPEIQQALATDIDNLIHTTISNKGHLADVSCSLRLIASSLNLKADKLSILFNQQKLD